ncbi:MAG: four helix bundle protein [Bacteroidia bacterium]|jgi:four helix bundle protein
MATIKRFEDLDIWQKARQLSKDIYVLTLLDAFSKNFALKDQIRRSSGSVMDNIAEGFDREGKREFIHFLTISKASLSETKSQLYRAFDCTYISKETFVTLNTQSDVISKQLGSFIKYLRTSDYKGTKFKLSEPIIEYARINPSTAKKEERSSLTINHKPETNEPFIKNQEPETKKPNPSATNKEERSSSTINYKPETSNHNPDCPEAYEGTAQIIITASEIINSRTIQRAKPATINYKP